MYELHLCILHLKKQTEEADLEGVAVSDSDKQRRQILRALYAGKRSWAKNTVSRSTWRWRVVVGGEDKP
jgi:hypothetical protein